MKTKAISCALSILMLMGIMVTSAWTEELIPYTVNVGAEPFSDKTVVLDKVPSELVGLTGYKTPGEGGTLDISFGCPTRVYAVFCLSDRTIGGFPAIPAPEGWSLYAWDAVDIKQPWHASPPWVNFDVYYRDYTSGNYSITYTDPYARDYFGWIYLGSTLIPNIPYTVNVGDEPFSDKTVVLDRVPAELAGLAGYKTPGEGGTLCISSSSDCSIRVYAVFCLSDRAIGGPVVPAPAGWSVYAWDAVDIKQPWHASPPWVNFDVYYRDYAPGDYSITYTHGRDYFGWIYLGSTLIPNIPYTIGVGAEPFSDKTVVLDRVPAGLAGLTGYQTPGEGGTLCISFDSTTRVYAVFCLSDRAIGGSVVPAPAGWSVYAWDAVDIKQPWHALPPWVNFDVYYRDYAPGDYSITYTHGRDYFGWILLGVEVDGDGDGWLVSEGDCDDSDATINPGVAELTDCIDNDCDGLIDEGDTMKPIGTISVSPAYIWPPNHDMVNITVNVSGVTDANLATVAITSITSSEPDNGLGDGDTTDDAVITGDLTAAVRAERSGKGTGRTYTITVTATDCAGNETDFPATVVVPHDKRK